MHYKEDGDVPVDIWRYILLFVPPSSLHHCCVINKLFNDLCTEPNLYKNLVCRIKCFSPVPLKIDDDTSTISISVYDQYNSYLLHYGTNHSDSDSQPTNQTQCKIEKVFNHWVKRLSKTRYLDLGSFPLDENHLSNDKLNGTIQNIVCNDTFEALHFDGFYSKEVKLWFLSYIVPKISSEIRHISLRWDEWTLPSLQDVDIYLKILNHFWICIDGRSHPFHFPMHCGTPLRDCHPMKFDQLQILSLYRLHFPNNTLQSLLSASCNLKVLYIFASSWTHENQSQCLEHIVLPPQITSISVLLCEGRILFDKCHSNLRHIMLDSPHNEIGQCILRQLINGMEYPNLMKISICFWPGISDKPDDMHSTVRQLECITNLIYNIHRSGNAKLLDTLSINVYQDTIHQNLQRKLLDTLSMFYGERFQFYVTTLHNLQQNCQFVIDHDEDKNFIQKMFRRRFGLLRNS